MLKEFQMSVLLDKLINEVQHLLSEEEIQKRKERNKRKSRRQALRGKKKK
jgi:hypothetical protein